MRNLPPLNPLVSFCSAAKHQSFTKAAQELNLTHGAISRAVKLIEEHFGYQLFERRNRRIYLNEKGQYFALKAEKILLDLEKVCEEMHQQSTLKKFSISCEPSLAMRWLMPRINTVHKIIPNIDIQLSTAGGPIDLASHKIDLAIRRSDFKWPEEYWVTHLGNEWIGPVCRPNYLDTTNDELPVSLHTRTRPSAWADWEVLKHEKLQFSSEKYFDHFFFSLQASIAGLGIAIGPHYLVADDISEGLLEAPFGFVETEIEYVALSLRNSKADEKLKSFLSWIHIEFQKAM